MSSFSSFGSRPIFRAAKTPKIPFLDLSLLPNPTESLATQAMVSVTAVLYCEIHCEFESLNSYSTIVKQDMIVLINVIFVFKLYTIYLNKMND